LSGPRFGRIGITHIGVRTRHLPEGEVADRPMNLVTTDKTGTQATTITAAEVLVHVRAAAIQYGEARLGFRLAASGRTPSERERL
jgi:hypothetical protein